MTPGTPLARFIDDVELRGRAITPLPAPAAVEAAVRQVDSNAKLVDRFVAAARAAGAQVERTVANGAAEVIVRVLKQHNIGSLLLAADRSDPLAATIEDAAQNAGVQIVHARDEATMFAVDASLTGVAAAVAETGSIFVRSGEHCSQSRGTPRTPVTRGESLIPPVHLALVRAGQIVADLGDVFGDPAVFRESSNCTVITGPSKTADIEGVLVTGVHGPGQLVLIVIDGA